MKRALVLPALLAAAGMTLVVAGVTLWLGAAGGLIAAGVTLVAFALLWERS